MTTLQVFYEDGCVASFGSYNLVAAPAQWTAIVYCFTVLFKPKIVPNVAFGVFFIDGATDEHAAADSPLRPGASAMVSMCVLSRVCDRCARVWARQNFSFEANFYRSGAVFMEFDFAGRNTRTANQLTDGRTQRAETAHHIPEATSNRQTANHSAAV